MKLIESLKMHLWDMDAPWQLCGGFAIDLYLGKKTRTHKDLDITVSFDDAGSCIQYFKSKGWEIDAPVGHQRLVSIDYAIENHGLQYDNIWCYKKGADFIKTLKIDGVYRYSDFVDREQTELDFIEVLFNRVENNVFYFKKDYNISLDADSAFIDIAGVSILAPEIILLYKSSHHDNKNYKSDFEAVVNKLEEDRYNWLIKAMQRIYPEGHPWLNHTYVGKPFCPKSLS